MKSILLFIFLSLFIVGCGESQTNQKCETGFSLVNDACVDINECELGTDNCHVNAICTNNEGSFSCECLEHFNGDGVICSYNPFLTTWNTDNSGVSNSTKIKIPTNPNYIYNYHVDCDNDGVFEAFNVSTSYTCHYNVAGTYQVAIIGEFPAIYFNNDGDRLKILSVDNWGSIHWKTMNRAFSGCSNLNSIATDSPNLSDVTDMSSMFSKAYSFNGNISTWDVSNVTNMSGMFENAISFNQPLNSWNVSSVTNMSWMFKRAESFNQDLSSWDVSNVTDMSYMFYEETSFNQDLNSWNVSNVIDMSEMFYGATSFNQPLNSWDVSNVTDMSWMFKRAESFNQDLSSWDVSNVTSMSEMFSGATAFNQDLSSWNVSNVTRMSSMFAFVKSFNQDLNSWDVSKVIDMSYMFAGTSSFNQDLSSWDVEQVSSCIWFANNTPSWTLPKPNFTSCNPN